MEQSIKSVLVKQTIAHQQQQLTNLQVRCVKKENGAMSNKTFVMRVSPVSLDSRQNILAFSYISNSDISRLRCRSLGSLTPLSTMQTLCAFFCLCSVSDGEDRHEGIDFHVKCFVILKGTCLCKL